MAHPSSWQSPVPYLFCGLAAMLGLIAFALFILGCSYWKLESNDRDVEEEAPAVFEDKCVVIMAGQEKPTFLATPTSSRASSFRSFTATGSSENDLALEESFDDKRAERGGSVEHEAVHQLH